MSKVITGKVRFSYANVWEPKAGQEGWEPRYSVSLIIPKSDTKTIKDIENAIKAAYEDGRDNFRKTGGKVPDISKLNIPLRDADLDEIKSQNPVYKGSYYITAHSKTQPGIVDAALNDITDEDEFYSGCYGKASIYFYPYPTGISCLLNNLQKLEDGERLGGRMPAKVDFKREDNVGDDFEIIDDGDDDFLLS